MVDEAVYAAKTAAILDAVQRVREVLPATPEMFRENRTAREVVVLYADVFLALADHGIVERPLAERLAAAFCRTLARAREA